MSKLLDRIAALETAKKKKEEPVHRYPQGLGELYELIDQRRAAGLPLLPNMEGYTNE